MGSLCLPWDLPNPGIEPRSPALQADSLPAEPPGKPKNIGVGSLSLLQRIFLTQEVNWSLLHCRQILYQLSHQGSPRILEWIAFSSPAGRPNPGITLGSPALQADSLPAEPPGKPKNMGAGSLSLLQGIFLTQELIQDLLHSGGFFTN